MVLFVVNLVALIILWLFAFIGLRQYEFAQQDGDTVLMKLFIHVLLAFTLFVNIYYNTTERSPVVSNSTVVEENKK